MPSAHLHLIVNARISNPPGPDDCDKVCDFMRGMVEHVRMKVLRDASALWCNEPGNEGITADILLTTSHSTLHIWNEPTDGLCRMEYDLYSCAEFSVDEVVDYINRHFDVHQASYKFLDRDGGLIDLDTGNFVGVVQEVA